MNYILIILITILIIFIFVAWFCIKVTICALELYMTRKKYSLPASDEIRECIDSVFECGLWKNKRR